MVYCHFVPPIILQLEASDLCTCGTNYVSVHFMIMSQLFVAVKQVYALSKIKNFHPKRTLTYTTTYSVFETCAVGHKTDYL